ncbi:MAG: winged helix-turn-helix transcriptional regulator [Candidatus Lokiarchaeota archaeon]|nr:winged helix-turn-helix transcriptional regulator [Candidatus Lokiarchaeota archaeon]
MESWNISKKLKNELLIKSSNIEDNRRRILFILRNLGPQRFTNLIKYSNLSRSTVSKYLNIHRKNKNIEQRIFTEKQTNKQYRGYVITERGIEKLGEEPLKLKDELFIVNELKENVRKLEDLIDFYKEINVEAPFIIHIVRIISKIGDNFFELQQDRDLYLSLFYIFYNSILGQGAFAKKYWHFDESSSQKFVGYKLNLDQFCEIFDVSREAINYLAKYKLLKSDFGFYLIQRENTDFFFHEEDLLGTTTLRLIRDKLIDEIINLQEGIYEEVYDLDTVAKDITNQLKEMGLIWDAIQEQFQLLVLTQVIKNAILMGFLYDGFTLTLNP